MKHKKNIRSGGYVALSLVSTIAFIMLIVSVSVAGRVMGVGIDVGFYESFRAARAAALSCVSIVREKVIEGSLETPGSGGTMGEILWFLDSLEGGECWVTSIETPTGFNLNIVARVGGQTGISAALAVHIEKRTGGVASLSFL